MSLRFRGFPQDHATLFNRQRYIVKHGLITADVAAFLFNYVKERVDATTPAPPLIQSSINSQEPLMDDPQTTRPHHHFVNPPTAYADPLMEQILARLRPDIEAVAGVKLHPTYSYYRVYRNGDYIGSHRDREACEISVSVNLGQEPNVVWPLWVEGPEGCYAAQLAPGDSLLYRGIECRHWREPFGGQKMAQLFLHYVHVDGPYAAWKFDKRKRLNC